MLGVPMTLGYVLLFAIGSTVGHFVGQATFGKRDWGQAASDSLTSFPTLCACWFLFGQ